jgi:type IV pilus assembly protein PilX
MPARGIALATCLLLLAVFAILAIAGFSTALIEQRIAANVAHREQAFQAAEYGIEQALHAGDLAIASTYGSPRLVPGDGTRLPMPSGDDSYAYRIYFAAATPSGLPPTDPAAALTAFHFVIEATGHGPRGARATHSQSFRVLRPADWIGGAAAGDCAPADEACVNLPGDGPRRTAWVQLEAE